MTSVIGMIVPPAAGEVPPEAPALYPSGVIFIAEGLGLTSLTPEGYDGVIGDVGTLARRLAERGASGVALMGTSLSFYRGRAFNEELIATIRNATGLPATTMSSSIVRALRAVGASRVALATAYVGPVNDRLVAFLEESGFVIAGLAALELTDVGAVHAVTAETLRELGERAWRQSPGADALFISCGGLRTLDVTLPLENLTGLPVVSSSVAGVWGAVQLVGLDTRFDNYGTLLALKAA